MKLTKIAFVIMLVLCSNSIFVTSVNGRFVVVKSDTSKLSVLLQINTNTGSDDMGGATIVVSFDKNVLGYNSNPITNQDYIFHNFSGGTYDEAKVTKPLSDKLWINIYLPSENNNRGTLVSGSNGWTDVVTLNFDVKNPRDTARVYWLSSNLFWQVYDADNSTNWAVGKFTNLINAPVTIELLSFTAVLLDNSNIQLDWSTITYADNAGYDVERKSTFSSSDTSASLSMTGWEKVGFVPSNKVLNTPVSYSFTDNTVNSTKNIKYRLKSVNIDATYTILKEIDVLMSPQSFELSQNYPNPFNPSTKIRYTIPSVALSGVEGSQTQVTMKIYDILGNEVATLVNEQQSPGSHEVIFDANGLSSGVYIYRLETSGFVDTKKMILLR